MCTAFTLTDHEDLFRQESFFYHLTGQNVPGHWIVIDIETEK